MVYGPFILGLILGVTVLEFCRLYADIITSVDEVDFLGTTKEQNCYEGVA
jgi:hypothetical protein